MFKFKKTYTIEFKKIKHDIVRGTYGGQCSVISTEEIIKRVIPFCSKNNIKLKTIYCKNYGSSYIQIKGTKEDYQKLISLLISDGLENEIKIKKLKW